MTIKEQRRQRKQRPRVLHDGNGFRPARDLIRRRLVSTTITFHTPFGGAREIARRRGRIPQQPEEEAALWQRIAAGW